MCHRQNRYPNYSSPPRCLQMSDNHLMCTKTSTQNQGRPLTIINIDSTRILFRNILCTSTRAIRNRILILFFPLRMLLMIVRKILLRTHRPIFPMTRHLIANNNRGRPHSFYTLVTHRTRLLLPTSSQYTIRKRPGLGVTSTFRIFPRNIHYILSTTMRSNHLMFLLGNIRLITDPRRTKYTGTIILIRKSSSTPRGRLNKTITLILTLLLSIINRYFRRPTLPASYDDT